MRSQMCQRWLLAACALLSAAAPLSAQTPAATATVSEPVAGRTDAQSTRERAYFRFLEARRLRSEAQRQRSQTIFDEAIAAYRDTIWLDPKAAEPRVDLGELYFFFRNDIQSAEREALEAVKLDNDCVGGHRLLARLSLALFKFSSTNNENKEAETQFKRGLSAYETVTRLDPSDAEAWAMLSDLYRAKNDTPRYVQALERWASAPIPADQAFYGWFTNSELTPDQAFAQLSQVYLSQSKKREAFDAARRAYEFNPENGSYAGNLIAIMSDVQTVEQSLKTYAQLSRSAPSAALEIGYSAALIRAGRYAEAIERLRPQSYVTAENPSAGNIIALLATAQRRANQRATAIETLKQGIAKLEAKQRIGLIFDLAETLEESGAPAEAVAQYETLYDNFAQSGHVDERQIGMFSRVVTELARLYRRLGATTKMQTMLTRTRKVLDEHSSVVETVMIEGLREDGKRREAFDLVRATIRRVPEDKSLRFTEIVLLAEDKRFRECEDLLMNMLDGSAERASFDAVVQMLLSNVQLQAGRLSEAEKAARQAVSLDADNPNTTLQLASVLGRVNKHDEAEKLLRALLQHLPDNATVLNNLGYALAERGVQLPEALTLLERAVTIEPLNGSFLDSLGWAQFKAGKLDQARATLEKALLYAKRNATLHEHLGDVLAKQGRLAEARRAWEKALTLSLTDNEVARLKGKLRDQR